MNCQSGQRAAKRKQASVEIRDLDARLFFTACCLLLQGRLTVMLPLLRWSARKRV